MSIANSTVKVPTYEEFIKIVESKKSSRSTEDIIRDLRERVARMETKYKMTSEEFLPRYEHGDFEMDDNYDDGELFGWKSALRALRKLTKS